MKSNVTYLVEEKNDQVLFFFLIMTVIRSANECVLTFCACSQCC